MRKVFVFGKYQLKIKAFYLNYQWISHHHTEEFPILSIKAFSLLPGET